MSKTRSTLAAALLTLVFAYPSIGGQIGSPANTPPPPPPTIDGGNVGAPGGPQVPENLGSNGLTSSAIVDILLAVLSLF